MKTDEIMEELQQGKDERCRRFGADVRKLCSDLINKQARSEVRHSATPLVFDFTASIKVNRARVAALPPPIPGETLVPDDPIMAELRTIRGERSAELSADFFKLQEQPPGYGAEKD